MMHGRGKSDFAIVAVKPANKAEHPAEQSAVEATAAEPVERRAETKGNASQQSTHRTQSWVSVSQALERIRPAFAVMTRGKSRMRESCMYGSARGAPGNGRPYRDRREFVTLLVGAAALPLAAHAQQPGRLRTIAFLGPNTHSAASEWVAALVKRLRELGWTEGRTITIEYRWAEGREERFAEIAAELVRLKADVIVTSGTQAVMASKNATSVIPIVFATAGDPVGTGLVGSLARPAGNVTGLATLANELVGKRLELLREIVPGLRRVAIMGNVANPYMTLELGEVQAAARTLGLETITLEIRRAQDLAPAFEALKSRADALYVCTDALTNTHRIRINIAALGERLPTMHGSRDFVEAGGLMSYGPNFPDMFRRTADYVDKILRGAKPGDLPVEQPTKFDLVVNLTTAKALRLDVPATLLTRTDEVIE
jgi:putative tryptophan/tyrosine transport system substrate-binding protein